MKVTGVNEVLSNLTKAIIAIQKSIETEVGRAALEVEREAKINTPVDTGRLRASITADRKVGLLYEVGTNVEYAAFQEFGTSKMAAQPYLGPAIDKVKIKYPNLIKSGVKLR